MGLGVEIGEQQELHEEFADFGRCELGLRGRMCPSLCLSVYLLLVFTYISFSGFTVWVATPQLIMGIATP